MFRGLKIFEVLILALLLIKFPSSIFSANVNHTTAKELEENENDDGYTFLVSGGFRKPHAMQYFKYLVSVRSRYPQLYFGDNHFCGGVIIQKNTVLTAAHCIMDKRKVLTRPRRLMVVGGNKNRLHMDNTTVLFPVSSTKSYREFIFNNTHDIAIIKLSKEIPTKNPAIGIMPLPTSPPNFSVPCLVIGWGRLYYRGPLSAVPSHINVTLNTPEQCEATVPNSMYVKDQGMLCAADSESNLEGPCRGDSGGPLICQGQLTGIVSWTIGCGSRTLPSLYTDIFYHKKWIEESMNEGNGLNILQFLYLLLILHVIL